MTHFTYIAYGLKFVCIAKQLYALPCMYVGVRSGSAEHYKTSSSTLGKEWLFCNLVPFRYYADRNLANHGERALHKWCIANNIWPYMENKARASGAGFCMQGRTFSAEHRAKMSAAQQGKTLSAETRAKMSKAKQGKPNGRQGKTLSAEHKAKLSAAKQNMSAETRAKLGDANRGKTRSAETRAKMSEAAKARWAKQKNDTIKEN